MRFAAQLLMIKVLPCEYEMEVMMEKWKVYAKKADFDNISREFGIDKVVARIIRNRDVTGSESIRKYLYGDKSGIYSPWLMKNVEKAVSIINQSIAEKEKIRVVGDYDIDGVCSGNILVQGLEEIGADVDFDVPDRINDGYGINVNIIKRAYDDGVNLIVTCDNGIAAVEAVEYAKSLGMKIIVTDHHEILYVENDGETEYIIPKADAVINPKQPDDNYPFRDMCGAGVAYKLIWALFEKNGKSPEEWEKYLEPAAIATIGDVVELKDENRIITSEGLKMLNHTTNRGLISLIEETGLTGKKISSYHIGFVLGPCLNAGGRLDTAKKSFRLLYTKSESEAKEIAKELKELNDERKAMTEEGFDEAVEVIENTKDMINDRVLVVKLEDCHESIVGIIAGRIREKYNKPVFVLTKVKDGLKGSGRSIEEYNMFEELVKCRHLFQKFGGHAMAAGISIDEDKYEELRYTLNTNAALTEDDLCRKVWIDVPMPFNYITDRLIKELDLLEPFGKGNEKPVFAQKNVKVLKINIFGKNRNVIRMDLMGEEGFSMEGTLFKSGDEFVKELGEAFGEQEAEKALNGNENSINLSVLYYPEINEYRGRNNIRVVIKRYLC